MTTGIVLGALVGLVILFQVFRPLVGAIRVITSVVRQTHPGIEKKVKAALAVASLIFAFLTVRKEQLPQALGFVLFAFGVCPFSNSGRPVNTLQRVARIAFGLVSIYTVVATASVAIDCMRSVEPNFEGVPFDLGKKLNEGWQYSNAVEKLIGAVRGVARGYLLGDFDILIDGPAEPVFQPWSFSTAHVCR